MIAHKIKINKVSHKCLCSGYCDFANDGAFNPESEEIIEKDIVFIPSILKQDWYWNETTQEFQTQPV